MKVVIATPLYPPEIGGPATYSKALHEEFVRRGLKAPVVRYGALERALPPGLRHLIYFLCVLPRVMGADAVLAFDTWSVGFPALIAAKLFGKKFIVRIGGDILWESYIARTGESVLLSEFYDAPRNLSFKERCIRSGTRFLTRHANALVFNTLWQKGLWERAYHIAPTRTHVVENYYPRERESVPSSGHVFVAGMRNHAIKNAGVLLEAFSNIKSEFPEVSLDTSTLSPQEHRARIASAYAVVIPSVSEVNPNTAVDAIRFGKPFIAPLDSGARNRLEGLGLFVDTRDPEALAEAFRTLLDADSYQCIVERINAFSFTHSWQEIADEILAFV